MERRKLRNVSKTTETNYTSQERSYIDCLKHFLDSKYVLALIVRTFSVFLVQTYFVPDEYWQSSEVAHFQTFGYGYITWEWNNKIRSYLYPFMFEIYFTFLKLVGADCETLVIVGPHLIQAIITALADVSIYHLTLKLFHDRITAMISFYLQLFSWFIFYIGSRTLSNTVEMCFISIGLSFLKYESPVQRPTINHRKDDLFMMLLFAGLSFIVRPTAIIVWFGVMAIFVLKIYNIKEIIKELVKVFPLLFLLLFAVDYYFYREFVVVHWNFFQFNVIEKLSSFYGSHPSHWYFSQGLPVVMYTHLLFVLIGVYCAPTKRMLFYIAVFYVAVHSLIAHKEFRFLLPIFPLLVCYAGHGIKQLSTFKSWKTSSLLILTLLLNIIPAVYFSMIHQRGVMDAMRYVRNEAKLHEKLFVQYLMPCHSTPYYSYVHKNVSMRFLTCLPNSTPGYKDEADLFFEQPKPWLTNHKSTMMLHPMLVVAFDVLPEEAKSLLHTFGYKKVASFFHSHFPEGRAGSCVDLYKRIT